MGEVKVSVIMPVHNAERFLSETLSYVMNQTLQEIEIICVNDGSSDSSEQIIRTCMEQDQRIRLINQENSYAGVARNNGLAQAAGEYVVFWDADDMFDETALEKMYQEISAAQADICVCGGKKYNEETGATFETSIYLEKKWLPENKPFSRENMPSHIFSFATNVPWNKMYRRAFVEEHGLKFQNLKQANDTYFVLMAFYLAQRITYTEETLVTYRTGNGGSLTGKASDTVFCAYESYLATWAKLTESADFSGALRKGFSVRFFRGMIHSLNSQKTLDAYKMVYDRVAKEGFQIFELGNLESEEFDIDWHFDACRNMKSMTAEEYLMWDLHRRVDAIEYKNARLKQQREQINRQKEKIIRLKEKSENYHNELKLAKKTLQRRCVKAAVKMSDTCFRLIGKETETMEKGKYF